MPPNLIPPRWSDGRPRSSCLIVVKRQRNIFLLALACSFCLHVVSLAVYVQYGRTHWPDIGAISKLRLAQTRPSTKPADELIVMYPDMGDAAGTGIGSNSSPGDRPLEAPQATEDQALLSRDPVGPGRIGGPPAKYTGPTGDGSGGTPAVALTAPPTPAAEPTHPEPKAADPIAPPPTPPEAVALALPLPRTDMSNLQAEVQPKVIETPKVVVKPQRKSPEEEPKKPEKPTPAEKPPVVVVRPQQATGDGRRPGVPQPSADPLPESESDSDPFSRISGSAVFRNGRLDVRRGRKVKTTRPQIQVAGQWDMLTLSNPNVVLEIHISPTGKVTDVRVAHSSGSNQIDEPTRLAVYDWWFEPAKDKSGKAVSDVIFFGIEFVN